MGAERVERVPGAAAAAAAPRHAAASQHPLLALQQRAGNRAVTSLLAGGTSPPVVRRKESDNPAEFVPWVEASAPYKQYAALPPAEARNQCHEAARAVVKLLSTKSIVSRILVVALWAPDIGAADAPGDHMVVLANIGGTDYVVDATMQQFEAGGPLVASRKKWEAYFKWVIGSRNAFAKEFASVNTGASWADLGSYGDLQQVRAGNVPDDVVVLKSVAAPAGPASGKGKQASKR